MQDPVKEIKEKLDIVDIIRGYIPIQQAGNSYKALCPFHKEKTPSFVISPDRQTWHCFGQCSEGGDVISFVMKYENVEFYDALKILAEKAGVELRKISPSTQREFGVLYDIHNKARDFFIKKMTQSEESLGYIKSRGITSTTANKFEIGFAPPERDGLMVYLINEEFNIDDIERAGLIIKTDSGAYVDRFRGRIMFPLYNTFGKVVAFTGRILEKYDNGKVGKYINSPETLIYHKSKILYGFHISKKFIKEKNEAVLVEGNMDMVMLWQDGVKNVVAISGTALTKMHLDIVGRITKKIILAFDNDSAGSVATERAIDMANEEDFSVSVLLIDKVKDMADFIYKNPGEAKNYLYKHLVSSMDFYINKYFPNQKTNEDIDKDIVHSVLKKTLLLYSPIERHKWIKKLSERIDISERDLLYSLDLIEQKNKKGIDKIEYTKRSDLSTSRINSLAFKILSLTSINKNILEDIKEYSAYFPEKFIVVIKRMEIGGDKLKDDKVIEKIEMQAVLINITKEQARVEAKSFLNEIKKEHFKNKMNELYKELAKAEKCEDVEKSNSLIIEIDEMVKLMNT